MNVIIGKRICDYCSVQLNPFHRTERLPGAVGGNFIKLTMRRNGESLKAELCDICLKDIAAFIDNERAIAEPLDDIDDLPGMWERADFE